MSYLSLPRSFLSLGASCLLLLLLGLGCNNKPFQIELIPNAGQSFSEIDVFSFSLKGGIFKDTGRPIGFEVSRIDGRAEIPNLELNPEATDRVVDMQVFGLTSNSNVYAYGASRLPFSFDEPSVFRVLISRTNAFGWLTRMETLQNNDAVRMLYKSVGHRSFVLPDGRVLLIGGTREFTEDAGLITLDAREHLAQRVMIFDPKTGSFAEGPPLGIPRAFHTVTPLGNNQLLILGGLGVIGTGTGEAFQVQALGAAEILDYSDPRRLTIYSAPAQPSRPRAFHQTVALSDGSLLVVGGIASPLLNPNGTIKQGQEVLLMEMYVAAERAFRPISGVPEEPRIGRILHQATAFSNDTVLVTGGMRIDERGRRKTAEEALLLRRSGQTWTMQVIELAGVDGRKRFDHTATHVTEGEDELIVVTGGRDIDTNATLRNLEIWTRDGRLISSTATLAEARYAHSATWLPNQKQLVIAGGVIETTDVTWKSIINAESIRVGFGGSPSLRTESLTQIQEKSGRYRLDALYSPFEQRILFFGGALRNAQNNRNFQGLDTAEAFTPSIPAP